MSQRTNKISLEELKLRYPDEYDIIQDKGDGNFTCLGKMPIEDAVKIPNIIIVHKTKDNPLEPCYLTMPPDAQPCAVVTNAKNATLINEIFEKYNQKVSDGFSNFLIFRKNNC